MRNIRRAFVLMVIGTIVLVARCSTNPTVGGGQNNGGGQRQSHHYRLKTGQRCDSATGAPTVCSVIITNGTSSTDDFSWEASSDPNVASVNPDSGTVSRGSSSHEIAVTVPSGSPCPVTVTFADSSTHGSISMKVLSVDGKPC